MYILYYSCLTTLATKLRLSISAITNKYGYLDVSPLRPFHYNPTTKTHQRLRIVYQYTAFDKQNQPVAKTVVLYNYRDVMARCATTQYNSKFTYGLKSVDINFLTAHKKYWRTHQKLNSVCIACGGPPPLEMHQIRKLNGKKTKSFADIMSALGRKQVALCKKCHYNVHRGLYNGLSPKDLFASQRAAAESQIKYTDKNIPDTLRWDDPTQKPQIMNQQIRFSGQDAYFICDKRKRIISKSICAYEHEFDTFKKHYYVFYYNKIIQNHFNRPLEF